MQTELEEVFAVLVEEESPRRSHALSYLATDYAKMAAPSLITFLYEDHPSLANHLSLDNQKLLKIFEEKQEHIRRQSQEVQAQHMALLEESKAYQEWKLMSLQAKSEQN